MHPAMSEVKEHTVGVGLCEYMDTFSFPLSAGLALDVRIRILYTEGSISPWDDRSKSTANLIVHTGIALKYCSQTCL